MARPLARPVLERIRVEQQLADQLAEQLPIVLNAIATQNATAREFERYRREFDERLSDLGEKLSDLSEKLSDLGGNVSGLEGKLTIVKDRNEFIRREVMYEARYGRGSRGVEVVGQHELDLAQVSPDGPPRVNLGSGHVPREGFVNVDARELEGVDVVADVRSLPFEPGTVAEIYSSHLVEHFPIEELRQGHPSTLAADPRAWRSNRGHHT